MKSIRQRLLLLVCAVWLPAAAGFGLIAWYTYQEQAAATRKQVEQFALGVSTVFERELDKRVVLARTLAASRAARNGDFLRFHEEAIHATTGTDDWALLATDDSILVNTRYPYSATPVPRVTVAPLTQGPPHTVYVAQTPVGKRPVITLFVPIPTAPLQRYNVGVSFEPTAFHRLIETMPAPFSGLTVVVNEEQVIMARSRSPDKFLGQSVSAGFKQRIRSNGIGFADSTTLDGVRSMTYLSPPNAFGWSVVVSVPRTELDAAAQRASAKATAASALLLVIGLGMALLGTRKINRTMSELQRAAALLGENRVPETLRTGVLEVDEVGRTLHDAGRKASNAASVLEQRVREAIQQSQEAQAKLLHSQKLEAIGRLTAGVAHDFNNLLQAMKAAHHLLARSVVDGSPRRALDNAVRATTKASDLIKQLMSFGRVQKLEPMVISLADIVLKNHEMTRSAVGERVVLSADLAVDLPDLFVDPVQLEMALLNLVFNARDALPNGGHIILSGTVAPPQEVDGLGLGAGQFVRLEIIDDGTGMSEEVLEHVFEPYFTTKSVGAGSGIGLAQVQSFAKQSGGDIRLTSELGRGTRVCLYLPAATSKAVPRTEPVAVAVKRRALTVLMVEDDPLISSVTMGALEAHGHTVTLCSTADMAIDVLETGRTFDLLFTDVVMPGKFNGLDLLNWCRANRPTLPVIVTTGYAEKMDEASAVVLRKPYELEALFALFERAHIQ